MTSNLLQQLVPISTRLTTDLEVQDNMKLEWDHHEEIVIGVLLCDAGPGSEVQLLDTAAVDLLGIISPHSLKEIGLPREVCEAGQKARIIYIAEAGRGSEVRLSGGLICKATVKKSCTSSRRVTGY